MEESDRRERGRRKLEEISQLPAPEADDVFAATTIDEVFGGLWQRPGLSDRDRRLLSLAIVGARGMDFEVSAHVGGALRTGDLSPAEMLEVILHVAYYAGWPCASVMYRRFRTLCDELGLEVPATEG